MREWYPLLNWNPVHQAGRTGEPVIIDSPTVTPSVAEVGWRPGKALWPASSFILVFFLIKQPVFSVAPKVLVWGLKKEQQVAVTQVLQSLSCTHLKPTSPVKGGCVWTESVLFRWSSTFSIKARLYRLLKKFRLEGCLQKLPLPFCQTPFVCLGSLAVSAWLVLMLGC